MYKGTSHRLSKFSLSTSPAASDLISQNSKPSVLQSKVSSLTVPFASKFFITAEPLYRTDSGIWQYARKLRSVTLYY